MKKLWLLLPVLSGVMWGSAGIFVRTLDAFGFDNCTMIFIRIVVAVILLFIGILIIDRNMLRIKLRDIWIFVVCGVFGILGLNLCYNQAMVGLTMSLAAVLLSMSPVFVMVMATFVLKEKITARKMICTAMAVVGCVLVSGVLESGGVEVSAKGVLAGIAAAFFYALYSIASKLAMKRKYNVFTITFYSMLTGMVVLLPFADWNIMIDFAKASPVGNTVFILVNALATSILPYVLYTLSLSYVDAGKVSILAAGGGAFFGYGVRPVVLFGKTDGAVSRRTCGDDRGPVAALCARKGRQRQRRREGRGESRGATKHLIFRGTESIIVL